MREIVAPIDEDFADLSREYERYIRKDTFWDQFNRGNRLLLVSLVLVAFFFSVLISSLVGLV